MGYKIIKEVIKEKPSKACVYDVGENNIIKYNLLILKKKNGRKIKGSYIYSAFIFSMLSLCTYDWPLSEMGYSSGGLLL